MRTLKFLFAAFILMNITLSWTLPKVSGQDTYYQDDPNKKILKEAVVGAGVGAISAGASGGSAGKGALIGAGTNVIGNAVLDTLTSSQNPQPQPQVQYVQQAPEYVQQVPERGYAPVDVAPKRGGCGRNQ